MWALRFFFYPSWSKMTVDNVQDHFIIPTTAATRFFLIVVPLMFFSGIVMVITESLIAFAGIVVSTYVGWIHIIPVNRTIKAGVASNEALVPLLKKWMMLNNIRWITVTIMWGAAVWYIIAKGNFTDAV
jgi:hypothetical protein